MWWKIIKHFFFVLYSDKAWVFYQLECVQGSLNIISGTKGDVKLFQFNFERFLSVSDLIKDSLCNVYHRLDWAGWVNTAHSQNQSNCKISAHKLRKKIYNWYYFFFSFQLFIDYLKVTHCTLTKHLSLLFYLNLCITKVETAVDSSTL